MLGWYDVRDCLMFGAWGAWALRKLQISQITEAWWLMHALAFYICTWCRGRRWKPLDHSDETNSWNLPLQKGCEGYLFWLERRSEVTRPHNRDDQMQNAKSSFLREDRTANSIHYTTCHYDRRIILKKLLMCLCVIEKDFFYPITLAVNLIMTSSPEFNLTFVLQYLNALEGA